MPERPPARPASPLVTIVDDQALAVLAAIDDLRLDLPGAVHDARVALRKFRSTLIVFRPLLDADACDALEHELRWFAGELGDARDAQVIRGRIEAMLQYDAPSAVEDDVLGALDESAAGSWQRAQAALGDARLGHLIIALDRVRLRGLGPEPRAGAMERIGSTLEKLLVRADQTLANQDEGPEDERLHLLRKRVKRIRFAATALRDGAARGALAGSGIGRVARTLEDLQDMLGEYQDAVVTARVLDTLGERMPGVADATRDLARGQRTLAARVRTRIPAGVQRVQEAARRLDGRTPDVHQEP